MVHAADSTVYAVVIYIRSVKLGPIAPYENFKLTAGSEKSTEGIDHAPVVSLMYRPSRITFGQNGFSFGFERDRGKKKGRFFP